MPLFGGANKTNQIPKGNNSPFSHRNSLPKGRANGSWIPSNKDAGKRANRGVTQSSGFKAKSFGSYNKVNNGYSFSSGSSRGSSSPFFGGRTGAVHNTAPKLHGTNYIINTRRTTPHLKAKSGVSASAISKVGSITKNVGGFVKAIPAAAFAKLLVVTSFFLNATAKGTSDGGIPEHIRNPGEQQYTGGLIPGGQTPGIAYYCSIEYYNSWAGRWLTAYTSKSSYYHLYAPITGYEQQEFDPRSPGRKRVYAIGKHLNGNELKALFYGVNGRPVEVNGQYNLNHSATALRNFQVFTLDGQTDTQEEQTSPTTNNGNAKVETKPDAFPPSIRPPFPSEETATRQVRSFDKPEPAKPPVVQKAVTKTPKGDVESNNNSPSPTPEPLPTPTPVKEKTIEEVEQPEVVETPKVISDTSARRADGSTERTIVREATKEELEEYNRRVEQANRKLESAQEVIEEATKYDDAPVGQEIRDVSEEIRQEMFGDPMTEKERFPFGRPPNAKQHAPSPVPTPTKQTTTQPVPEPDVEPTEQPSPTPSPVKQSPPSKDPVEKKLDDLPSLDDIAITVAGLDIIKQIAQKAGSASPVCLAPTLQAPIARNNRTTLAAQGAILGQGQVTQNVAKAANATLSHPKWGLQAIVTNANYGLQKIQGFASTAWKVTKADKIMAGVSMALTVHNAMMLSNNLLSTISEATNLTFEALGIRDAEDEPIDLGRAIRNRINGVLASVLGEANYEALTLRIAKANRIYQAGINLLDATYSLFDSARTVAELTAEHMGEIGNALREAGVVYEDAYNEMTEKITPQNTAMRKLGSFRERLSTTEDAFDTVAQISGAVVETKENIAQIQTEKEELREEIDGFVKEQEEEKDEAKEAVQVSTDINPVDFDPASSENP